MSIRVDFYLVNAPHIENCGKIICRLAEKAYQQKNYFIIRCDTPQQTEFIDHLLWTYQDIGFIPHQRWPLSQTTLPPIILCETNQPIDLPDYSLLFNLTANLPDNLKQFKRIVEILPNNTQLRASGRERYRYYQNHGCTLYSHTLA